MNTEVEDIDEDIPAYEEHILLMEEQVADLPQIQDNDGGTRVISQMDDGKYQFRGFCSG